MIKILDYYEKKIKLNFKIFPPNRQWRRKHRWSSGWAGE